jgi:large subunit ribosomal protein L6
MNFRVFTIHCVCPMDITAKVKKYHPAFSIDKDLLAHWVPSIRRLRPPEPYKGKGVKR